ncbi:MAG TPA: hypothetical protein EYQ25_02620 [Planctomycetes bacterium]|jgi:uncharacterized membrane protein YgcG|nr:hypothetical protein [Planctomycetota bacterium]HIL36337.1 hypothetical protein [Planctomycetota bacterium]
MPNTPRPILRAAVLLILGAIALAILPLACVEQNDDFGGGGGSGGGSGGGDQSPPGGGISFSISGDA